MNRRNRWFAGLAGTVLALAMTATVFAVSTQETGNIIVSGPIGTLECEVPLTFTATVSEATPILIAGQEVAWSFSVSPSLLDAINATPTTTDAFGVATTTVTLANVAGNRTLTATADGISANAVLVPTCAGVAGITAPGPITAPGLLCISTMPDGSPVGNLPIATILALLAVLVGGGIIVRRFAFSPR